MSEQAESWWPALIDWLGSDAPNLTDLLVSAGVLALAVVIALLFGAVIFRRLLRISILSGIDFDVKTMAALRIPLAALIVLAGAYLAIALLSPPSAVQAAVNTATAVLAALIAAYLVHGVGSASLLWLELYSYRANLQRTNSWTFPLLRRGLTALVVGIASLFCLDIMGINVSPLLAGLGIAGLAVALALQPTLGNLFAGTYVVTEGLISVGDYIEMPNGIEGYVVDVSWRSTRLLTWTNNLVVVPNSLFAETIITNLSKPGTPLDLLVTCGVAYESDLKRVETVSLEILETMRDEVDAADPDTAPVFRYERFGESNIEFYIKVRARDRDAGFVLRHELIKRLHDRFAAEGIKINYPVRALQFPTGPMPRLLEHMPAPTGDGGGGPGGPPRSTAGGSGQ